MNHLRLFSKLNCNLAANVNSESKKTRILLLTSLFLVAISIFLTIIGQLPFFSTRSITQIFKITWIFTIIPIIMLSYKYFIRSFLSLLCLLVPFLLYLFVALLLNVKAISYQGTILIFLSFYIFLIGKCLSPYINKSILKLFAISYLIPSLVYAAVIYFQKLRGVDISGSIYAVSTKNSTGPIIMIGAFASLIIFDRNKLLHILTNIIIISFVVILVALMKCRTVLLALPVCFTIFVFTTFKNIFVRIGLILTFVGIILIIILVPPLNQRVIQDILLRGKTDIDSIFSGRISQTIHAFSNFKPAFGSGGTYIDCMPLSFLLSYGIVGFLSLLLFSIMPFASLLSYKVNSKNGNHRKLFYSLIITIFISQYLFEGFGYFGPGAKSFIFWLFAGFEAMTLFQESRSKVLVKIDDFSTKISSISNPVKFSLVIEFSLLLLTLLAFIPRFYIDNVCEFIYSKLPSTSEVTDYIEATNVSIYSENLEHDGKRWVLPMCCGQKIKMKFKADNEDCDDIFGLVFDYDDSQKNDIIINSETNEVSVVNEGNLWRVFSYSTLRYNKKFNCYVTISKTVDDYQFNSLKISHNRFSESFEFISDETIDMGVSTCNRIYYDTFYVPDSVDVSFHSSNSNIATINETTGEVKGVSCGNCYIYATITNSKGVTYTSNNKILINVKEDFVNCYEMTIDQLSECYQYEPLKLGVVLNEDASDKTIRYSIDGLLYHFDGNTIVFEESGVATVSLTSISNPTLSKTIQIEVKENHPVTFTASIDKLKVGNIYNPADVGLYIHYNSGHKFLVTDDALSFDKTDFSGRAWHSTNGMVKDHCTFKAVKTGSYGLNLVSRYDKNIKSTLHFNFVKYTINEYNKIMYSLSLLVVLALTSTSYIVAFLIPFKKKSVKNIIIGIFILLFSSLSLLLFKSSLFLLINCCFNLLIGLSLICINLFILNDGWPLIFDEYVPKQCDKIDNRND